MRRGVPKGSIHSTVIKLGRPHALRVSRVAIYDLFSERSRVTSTVAGPHEGFPSMGFDRKGAADENLADPLLRLLSKPSPKVFQRCSGGG